MTRVTLAHYWEVTDMSSRERLENACIEPGLWLVEGHQVQRVRTREGRKLKTRWVVRFPDPVNPHRNTHVRYVDTLNEAFDMIADMLHQGDKLSDHYTAPFYQILSSRSGPWNAGKVHRSGCVHVPVSSWSKARPLAEDDHALRPANADHWCGFCMRDLARRQA
jgi:hypothetical protein